MTTANDLMRPCPVFAESATVADLLARMEQGQACAIVDGHGRVTGIVTEFDLVRLIYESGQFDEETMVAGNLPAYLGMTTEQLRTLPASEIMTPDPEGVAPGTDLEELVRTIFRNHRKVLLVLRDGQLAGAIYRMDVAKRVLG